MNKYRVLVLTALVILLGLIWAGRSSDRGASLLPIYPTFGGSEYWWEGLAVWPSAKQSNDELERLTDNPINVDDAWNKRSGKISDRVLYATLTLRMSHGTMDGDNEDDLHRRRAVKSMVAWLKRGQKLDPDNGLYNLLLMDCYLEAAIKYPEYDDTKRSTDGKLSKGLFGALTLPAGVTVRDERYLKEALAEYRLAVRKTVHTYQQQARTEAFRGLTKPVIYEQFVPRRWLNEAITEASYSDHTKAFEYAMRLLVKRGDISTAEEMLNIPSYFGMLKGNSASTECNAVGMKSVLETNAALLHDMAVLQKDDQKARHYLLMHQQLGKLDLPCVWSGYFKAVRADDHLAVEMGYSTVLRVLVWLLMLCVVRQILWAGWAIITRRSNKKTLTVSGIGKVTGIMAGAYLVIAVIVQAVITWLRGSASNAEQLAAWLIISPLVIGWLWLRWRFKRICQHEGMAIPGRIQEAVCNWLPVAVFVALFVAAQVISMKYCGSGFMWLPPYGWIILAVAVVAVTWFKLRTPDYYTLANLNVQHFLACLVLWLSLAVMPLLLASEVVILHFDNTGIGAHKSVEQLNERAHDTSSQALVQIQDIIRKVK